MTKAEETTEQAQTETTETVVEEYTEEQSNDWQFYLWIGLMVLVGSFIGVFGAIALANKVT